ncbi:MAG: hypothetical protein ACJ746_08855 [Bryobacteraceae bacterium]
MKGNHLVQFGGSYQRNFNYHQRDDNGAGIFNNTVYQVGGAISGVSFPSAYIPGTLPSNQVANWNNFYTEVLGIVSQPQVLYTRSGTNLALQALGTNLSDRVTIPYYNVYFSDTWRMRKDLTLTYGLGYQIEMPPTEEQGRQVARGPIRKPGRRFRLPEREDGRSVKRPSLQSEPRIRNHPKRRRQPEIPVRSFLCRAEP